jgi:hypothetical protein
LTDYNICIEFDGEQHFNPKEIFGGIKTLELQQIKDKKHLKVNSETLLPFPKKDKFIKFIFLFFKSKENIRSGDNNV